MFICSIVIHCAGKLTPGFNYKSLRNDVKIHSLSHSRTIYEEQFVNDTSIWRDKINFNF